MRSIAAILLIQFIGLIVAPAVVVGDFWAERAQIERELCVQRMVPGEQRTCHGECQLMKRLAHSDERGHDIPEVIRSLRLENFIAEDEGLHVQVPSSEMRLPAWGTLLEEPLDGHLECAAPVPWC